MRPEAHKFACDLRQATGRAFRFLGVILVITLGLCLFLYLMQPEIAPSRNQYISDLQQIGQAWQSYHDTYHHCPPAAIKSKDGKPLLSWRVALLPFIEHYQLYKKFKLDEPWDSPH